MKIENVKKYGKERFLNIEQFSKEGDGTIENPILIDPSSSFPENLQIRESDLYIQIKDCSIHTLILKNCKNVTISKCQFHDLRLEKSTIVEVDDSRFQKALVVLNSKFIKIKDCSINLLSLTHSHNNTISNCVIEDAMNEYSRANSFQNLLFSKKPEKYKQELLKSYITRKVYYLLPIVMIAITISGTMRLWEFGLGKAISFLSIMVSGTLLFVCINFIFYLKTRRYEPNKFL
jgi:hypothetical protein